MKEIKCLAKVDGTDYYSESDLLNAIKENGIIQEEIFLYEDYSYRSLSDNLDIGYCINSIPCFCRTGEKSRENYSYIAVRCCSVQKDKIRFDEACPKCGWGVAAYLAVHCKLDKDFGICYYDVNWSETNKETVFEYYLNWRKRIYDIMNIRSYTHYQAIGESTSIKMLDEAFYKQHLTEETKYKELSKGMSDNFFDGKLDRVVGEYLTFVNGKMQNAITDNMNDNSQVNSMKQTVCSWIIDNEVLLRVFDNDRGKAISYLDKVIGNCNSATDYGKKTKILKINIPYGYSKKFWKMICDNDKSQSEKGYSTFNKGRI